MLNSRIRCVFAIGLCLALAACNGGDDGDCQDASVQCEDDGSFRLCVDGAFGEPQDCPTDEMCMAMGTMGDMCMEPMDTGR